MLPGNTNSNTNNNVEVYPNPANTLLNVQTQLAEGKTENMCIYNAFGQRVKCLTLTNNLTTIPVNDLAAGIYMYRITDMQGNLIKADKIMLMH